MLSSILALTRGDIPQAVHVLALMQWSTVGLVLFAVWTTTRSVVIAACTVLGTFANVTFALYARFIWNPSIVFPATGAALLAALLLMRGHWHALPVLVLMASLMVQAHMATLPVAGVLVVGGLVGGRLHRQRPSIPAVVIATAVALVAWAPPLLEALRARGGNLAAWIALSRQRETTHGVSAALDVLRQLVAEISPLGVAAWCFMAATLVVSTMVGWSRRPNRGPLLLTTAIWMAFLASVVSIPGAIETYYLRYAFVPLALTYGLAWAGLRDVSQRAGVPSYAIPGVLVLVTGVGLWVNPPTRVGATLASPVVTPHPLSDVGRIAALVRMGSFTAPRAGAVAPTRVMPATRHDEPCTFQSDADLAFPVGRAVALLVGCTDAIDQGTAVPRFRITSPAHEANGTERLLYRGRSAALYAVPDRVGVRTTQLTSAMAD